MKKRLFDIAASSLSGVTALPVMAVIALAVKAAFGSPVIFRQTRLGQNGIPFDIYKFRSMTFARDENGALLPDAMRTTRFSRLLRKSGLDELPQVINILKGDMSIVGPRPRPADECMMAGGKLETILSVRPGLTGYAQVKRLAVGHTLDWQERFRLDFEYATERESLYRDLKIIAATIPIFIKGNGETPDARKIYPAQEISHR